MEDYNPLKLSVRRMRGIWLAHARYYGPKYVRVDGYSSAFNKKKAIKEAIMDLMESMQTQSNRWPGAKRDIRRATQKLLEDG